MITILVSFFALFGASYFLCSVRKISGLKSLIISALIGVGGTSLVSYVQHLKPSATPNVLMVGTSADFPPFTFMKEDKIVGFDIDVIHEVAKRLDKPLELKNMPFSTLLPCLQLGSLDVVAAGLTATPERAKTVLFTQPHTGKNPFVIVSLRTAPVKSIKELEGKEVIVNEGFTADKYLSQFPGLIIKRLKTTTEAFLALKSGRASAFVTAEATIKPFFEKNNAENFTVAEIPGTAEASSLAIAPTKKQLRNEIQHALDAMKKDGTLSALHKKWGLSS